jgi:hypothetical protein
MQSDDPRVRIALDVLANQIAEFRAAIAGALAQAEAVQVDATADPDARAARAGAELGVFAEGRIDPQAFAARFARVPPAGAAAGAALARAVSVLRGVLERGDQVFAIEVPPGGDLAAAIGAALEQVGRAFGAIQLADQVRSGCYDADDPDPLLAETGFRRWNRAERRFAPPLVVSVDGADLHAAPLADFCDGRAKLLLVVRGPCAPAPLVRLITPGTLVVQTVDRAGLDHFAGYQGPAVAALMPQGAARFLHDPAGGKEPWQRLSVLELPEPPRRALGGISAWQMAEDLQQLHALARTPFSIPAPGAAPSAALGESDAVDRLTSWLLARQNPLEP